jgi:hypothetical protein
MRNKQTDKQILTRAGQWPSHQSSSMIESDAVCDDCSSSKSATAFISHDSDPGLVQLQPTGEINQSKNHSRGTQGAGGVAKAQTELRISVPICKQFFILLHNTDLTRILSQRPSHKFSNNQFSHKSCREWLPDAARATNHFCHASHVPPVRLEVLGEGGSAGRGRGGKNPFGLLLVAEITRVYEL